MNIENIFVVKLDTPVGPRYCVLVQTYSIADRFMKNGKKIPCLSLGYHEEFNPWGFGTLEEIRSFYDWEKYAKGNAPIPKPFSSTFYYTRKNFWGKSVNRFGFQMICETVTEILKRPVTIQDLFPSKPDVDIYFRNSKGDYAPIRNIPIDEALEEWAKRKDSTVFLITFNTVFATLLQRAQFEKSYFLLNLDRYIGIGDQDYVMVRKKTYFQLTPDKELARQFRNEKEVLAYVDKYAEALGATGYVIEEVPGMTLEEGLSKS